MRSSLVDHARYVGQMLNGFRAHHEQHLAHVRWEDLASYISAGQRQRVLDLANGRLRPQYTLLRAHGHRVYGIYLVNYPRRTGVDLAYRVARALFNWQVGGSALRARADTLACGDVGYLPFADASFDLITSVAAFEHFLDVPRVVCEMQRVLRYGGVVWVLIHLFTSPSGGHNVSLTEIPLRHVPRGVDAWDHLRRRLLPFHVPLNEWRRDQYVEEFSQHFKILTHYCLSREGEALLLPAIASELSAYDRDELTCGALVIVARKAQ